MDSPLVHRWATAPKIVERVKGILGPDLLILAGQFWDKEPGGKRVPWHQDYAYWPIEPTINVTAWMAITPSKRENACIQFIPGSHRAPIPHVEAKSDAWFNQEADPAHVDESKAIDMELESGQFVLFKSANAAILAASTALRALDSGEVDDQIEALRAEVERLKSLRVA